MKISKTILPIRPIFGCLVVGLLLCNACNSSDSIQQEKKMKIEKTPEIEKILETLKDKNVNETTDYGITPLMLACSAGNTDYVKALLLSGADVNKQAVDGATALIVASRGAMPTQGMDGYDDNQAKKLLQEKEKNLLEIVKLLISQGADVNAHNQHGLTPLLASVQGMPTAKKQELALAAEWVNNSNEFYHQMVDVWNEITPDHSDISVALLKAGANVNAQNYNGATPLMYAVENNNEKMVKILLQAGADVKLKTKQGYDALDIAQELGKTNIIKLLKSPAKGAEVSANTENKLEELLIASSKGDIKTVKALLNAGADVNAKDNATGFTALMAATSLGYTDLAQMLIDAGSDVNAKDLFGQTALMYAAPNGHSEIVKLLLDAGADINAQEEHGETALMQAASKGHGEVVKLLLDAGADVNAKQNLGVTALMFAEGKDQIVELLKSAGAKE